MIKSMEARAGQPIPPDRRDEIMRGALDQLVVYTLLSQESKTRGIKVEDAEIDSKMQQLRGQFPDAGRLRRRRSRTRGMTLESLKHGRARRPQRQQADGRRDRRPCRGPSDAEAKDFYDKNPDHFKQEEAVRASHILIRVDEKADAATKKKARAEIDVGAEAGEGRRRLRQARAGALAGRQRRAGRRPELLPARPDGARVRARSPSRSSRARSATSCTTQFGYHIIKVTDHKPAPHRAVRGSAARRSSSS